MLYSTNFSLNELHWKSLVGCYILNPNDYLQTIGFSIKLMNFWLVKQEPSQYNWDQFVIDKETYWDGVRNYQARNNLKKMKKGDLVFFYHSVVGKEIKGIAKVSKEYYPDPTSDNSNWVVVNLKPYKPLSVPITLDDVKNQLKLSNIALIKQSRLSVMPLTKMEFKIILKMGNTKISGL